MGIPLRELQHCNTATARAEPSLLELCRAPAVVDEVNTATARAENCRKQTGAFAESRGRVCMYQKYTKSARACSLSCAPFLLWQASPLRDAERVLRRFAEVLQRTVPFVYFLLKKVAEIFGGFRIFLYLCSTIQRNGKAGRRPPGVAGRNVSNAMKNTYNYGKK